MLDPSCAGCGSGIASSGVGLGVGFEMLDTSCAGCCCGVGSGGMEREEGVTDCGVV